MNKQTNRKSSMKVRITYYIEEREKGEMKSEKGARERGEKERKRGREKSYGVYFLISPPTNEALVEATIVLNCVGIFV